MSMKPQLLDIKECDWGSPRKNMRGGVCFQGGTNVTMTIGEGRYPHETKVHAHDYEQTVFIYQGECEFYVDGVPYHMDEGCLMVVPPDVEHGIAPPGQHSVYGHGHLLPQAHRRPEGQCPGHQQGASELGKRGEAA